MLLKFLKNSVTLGPNRRLQRGDKSYPYLGRINIKRTTIIKYVYLSNLIPFKMWNGIFFWKIEALQAVSKAFKRRSKSKKKWQNQIQLLCDYV